MFSEHKLELSSGPVHYRKGGSGPPLLHLHGSGGPVMSPVLERLAQRHTICQPTVPGFDDTPPHRSVRSVGHLADLYAELIRKACGGAADVVGVSFGGWIALWLAARCPDVVDQLVLQAPAGLRDPGTGGVPDDPAEVLRMLYAVPDRAPKATRSPEVAASNRRVRDDYAAGISLDQPLLDALPGIKARTLVLFGTRDEVCPVEKTGRRVKAGIANSHLSFIYGAAHALEFDAPERVGPLVGRFLERGEAFVVRTPDAA